MRIYWFTLVAYLYTRESWRKEKNRKDLHPVRASYLGKSYANLTKTFVNISRGDLTSNIPALFSLFHLTPSSFLPPYTLYNRLIRFSMPSGDAQEWIIQYSISCPLGYTSPLIRISRSVARRSFHCSPPEISLTIVINTFICYGNSEAALTAIFL